MGMADGGPHGGMNDDGQGCLNRCKTRKCAYALVVIAVLLVGVVVAVVMVQNRSEGRTGQCKCVIPSDQGATVTTVRVQWPECC